MAVNLGFGSRWSWALGLGLLGGVIAGSAVPAASAAEEVRHILGLTLLFAPSVYALIRRRQATWERKHPYVRFVVFMLSMLVSTVLLVEAVVLVTGEEGTVATIAAFVAALVGFGVTAWIVFLGGAELIWDVVIDWADIRW